MNGLTIVDVTGWDIAHDACCVECGASFQANDVKVERDTGKGWDEDICVNCAYGPT